MYIRQQFWSSILLQSSLICLSAIAAWLLRFEFALHAPGVLFAAMPLLLAARLVALAAFKSLHGYWLYTGATDVARLCKAVAAGSVCFFVLERYVVGERAFPLSVYAIEAVVTTCSLIVARLLAVLLVQSKLQLQRRSADARRILIIGAGFAGHMLVRELGRPGTGFSPVAFCDDDPRKLGAQVHGVPVVGTVDDLPALASSGKIDEILIAVPSATKRQMKRFVELCQSAHVPFRSVPSLREFASGSRAMSDLRSVNVEDLLGRDPIELDLAPVLQKLKDEVVMVTGAAGSIGSELCAQVLQCAPKKLICVDQDETGLFDLGIKLEKIAHSDTFDLTIADITDDVAMERIIGSNEVSHIFHAAAYKHVPLVESNLVEAVKNNVLALRRLIDIAEEAGCRRFVQISSDKAVNPTSFMGCTKRIGELLISARPKRSLECVCVRFGNVLGSQGSVVPVFTNQILSESRITVTHPDMTRFFMTISEAVALVLQAFAIGSHGDVLVLDMGEPVKIVELARTLIALAGKSEQDVAIEYSGLRPGEKLSEELFYADEKISQTSLDRIWRSKGRVTDWDTLNVQLDQLAFLVETGSDLRIREKAREIVPEYSCGWIKAQSERHVGVAPPQMRAANVAE